MLQEESDLEIPAGLLQLTELPVIHEAVCKPDEIEGLVSALYEKKE